MTHPQSQPNIASDEVVVTMVFKLSKSKFKQHNPLNTETVWGIPYGVGAGDYFEKYDEAVALLEKEGLR